MPKAAANVDDEAIRIIVPLCAVFRRKLRAERLKYTPERAKILDAVIAFTGPFQAEQLIARLRSGEVGAGDLRISKATVYRTIKLLAEAGIIQQVLVDAEHAHYQLAYGRTPTGLLIRTDTHEITQLDLPDLAATCERACRERGLVPQGYRLVVYASAD